MDQRNACQIRRGPRGATLPWLSAIERGPCEPDKVAAYHANGPARQQARARQSASYRRKFLSKRMELPMFDPERLLGQMLGGTLGDAFGGQRGRRKRTSVFGLGNVGKAQVGLGL